jgi:uroporphyrinogen-III decarboxylase
MAGEGPVMELGKPKNMRWAGMPGDIIDKNSIHQFIEYPLLLDDEFDEFFNDRTGWAFRKALPRLSGLTEHFANFHIDAASYNLAIRMLAAQLSTPAAKEMIKNLWAIDEFYQAFMARAAEIEKEVEELGYPSVTCGMASVPFDDYSDFLRGSIESMTDLYDRPKEIERFIEGKLEVTLAMIRSTKGQNDGKWIFMPLHKGMDGFMNDAHYRKYYWSHLQKIILAIIDAGKVPFIYTEGKYNTRLDCLSEVPPGKVYYHFEEVDMAVAKKKLGGIACISGGFRSTLLDWGTPEEVREEVKRHLDACAPGGGYIFETSCGIGNAKRENVEAMFETVREFGKY